MWSNLLNNTEVADRKVAVPWCHLVVSYVMPGCRWLGSLRGPTGGSGTELRKVSSCVWHASIIQTHSDKRRAWWGGPVYRGGYLGHSPHPSHSPPTCSHLWGRRRGEAAILLAHGYPGLHCSGTASRFGAGEHQADCSSTSCQCILELYSQTQSGVRLRVPAYTHSHKCIWTIDAVWCLHLGGQIKTTLLTLCVNACMWFIHNLL